MPRKTKETVAEMPLKEEWTKMYETDRLFEDDELVVPPENEGEVTALVPMVIPQTHHLVVGMGTLAAMSEEDFAAKLEVMRTGQARIKTIMEQLLIDKEDYGRVRGIERPFLHQPGAEKLSNFYGFAVRQEAERIIGIERPGWWDLSPVQREAGERWLSPPLAYHVKSYVHLGDFSGPIVAMGYGEASSWEEKHRYRWSKPACPKCGREGLIKGKADGKLKGKWWCPGKEGGCNSTFEAADPQIPPLGKVENTDPYSLAETLVQMASKRCLSGPTPMLMKISGRQTGIIASDLSYAYQRWSAGREIWLPTTDGSWTQVTGIVQTAPATTLRIDLADGQFFVASPDHRWPTDQGLVETRDLTVGMTIDQAAPNLDTPESVADPEWGWAAGLFIADGNYPSTEQPHIARYTLNDGTKMQHIDRLRKLASTIGSTVSVTNKVGHTVRVQINGPFSEVLHRFVDGTKANDKRPSRHAWRQGAAFVAALVDGYLDGDGSIRKSRAVTSRKGWDTPRWQITFTRENHHLATFLRLASAALGYRLALREGMGSLNGEPYPTWRGWLTKALPTTHPMALNEIVNISPDRMVPTYDVEVAHPDHVFVIGGGVLTHNSFVASIRRATGTSGLFTQDEDSPSVIAQVGDTRSEEPDPVVTGGPNVEVAVGAKTEAPSSEQLRRLVGLSKEKDIGLPAMAELFKRLFDLNVEASSPTISVAARALTAAQLGQMLYAMETGDVSEFPTSAAPETTSGSPTPETTPQDTNTGDDKSIVLEADGMPV